METIEIIFFISFFIAGIAMMVEQIRYLYLYGKSEGILYDIFFNRKIVYKALFERQHNKKLEKLRMRFWVFFFIAIFIPQLSFLIILYRALFKLNL